MFVAASFWDTFFSVLVKLLLPLASVLLGWFWGRWQAQRNWASKQFRSSVVLSLNLIDIFPEPDEQGNVGSLKLRTLFEREIHAVFPPDSVQKRVQSAMDSTKEGESLVHFPKEESWYVLNMILNQIAGLFPTGTMRVDMGLPVERRWYTFCLTFENDGRAHQFKPRILLLDRERFANFPEEGSLILETKWHSLRVDTIRALKRQREKHPHLFMDIELAL